MTKNELTNSVADQTGYDAKMVLRVIEVTNDTIRKQVAKGDIVTLRGFGTYRPILRSRANARNISAGTTISMPPKYFPSFKPCQRFKSIVGKIKVVNEQFQTV